eukprot:186942_1
MSTIVSIGDLKLSLQTNNHGHWALCDGTLLPIDGAYSLLFNVIGHTFGAYNDSNGTGYFQLPNTTDSVLGIGGKTHPIGETIGKEEVVLTNNQLPKHTHPCMGLVTHCLAIKDCVKRDGGMI